jgi:hypothetical protein
VAQLGYLDIRYLYDTDLACVKHKENGDVVAQFWGCALLEMDLRNTSWFKTISKSLRTSLVLVQKNTISTLYCTTK